MAGYGPAPKPAHRRARKNADTVPQTVLRFEAAEAPDLPTFSIRVDDTLIEYRWPERTLEWWETWKACPQAEYFSSTDWESLLDTALVHAKVWSGDLSMAGELRLRVAKFGATMEDRARLRLVFAEADEKDAKRAPAAPSSKAKYGTLHALPPAASDD